MISSIGKIWAKVANPGRSFFQLFLAYSGSLWSPESKNIKIKARWPNWTALKWPKLFIVYIHFNPLKAYNLRGKGGNRGSRVGTINEGDLIQFYPRGTQLLRGTKLKNYHFFSKKPTNLGEEVGIGVLGWGILMRGT